jgi:hypothetical protein
MQSTKSPVIARCYCILYNAIFSQPPTRCRSGVDTWESKPISSLSTKEGTIRILTFRHLTTVEEHWGRGSRGKSVLETSFSDMHVQVVDYADNVGRISTTVGQTIQSVDRMSDYSNCHWRCHGQRLDDRLFKIPLSGLATMAHSQALQVKVCRSCLTQCIFRGTISLSSLYVNEKKLRSTGITG